MVELALLSPILILCLAGAMDFGRFFYTTTALTGAANAGVQYGVQSTAESTDRNAERRHRRRAKYLGRVGCGDAILPMRHRAAQRERIEHHPRQHGANGDLSITRRRRAHPTPMWVVGTHPCLSD